MMICNPQQYHRNSGKTPRDLPEQAGAKRGLQFLEPMAAALGIGIDGRTGR